MGRLWFLLVLTVVSLNLAGCTIINRQEWRKRDGPTGNLNGPSINGVVVNGFVLDSPIHHIFATLNGVELNSNAIGYNGPNLNTNSVFVNGLLPNALSGNGLSPNTLYSNGIFRFGNTSSEVTLNGLFINGNLTENIIDLLESLTLSGVILDARIASKLTTNDILDGSFLLQDYAINSPSIFKAAILKNGTVVYQVWAEGSSLKAQVGGTYVTGADWEDAVLLFSLVFYANDSIIFEFLYVVIVESVTADSTYPDLFSWNLTSTDGTPYCQNGLATIIPDAYWDANTAEKVVEDGAFTIACAGGALYKCSALLKYRPYITYRKFGHTVSLDDYHQACVRLIRADYCGDGVPHTVNGKLIDVWDNLLPTINTRENTTWPVEAYWTPTGASCFNISRIQDNFDGWCGGYELPFCYPNTVNSYVANAFPPYGG